MSPEERFNNGFSSVPTDDYVSEHNNGFNNFNHSDTDLYGDLRGMEDRRSFFENPDPFAMPSHGDPEFVAHAGFSFMNDLDEYIREIRKEIKDIQEYWRVNGPRLEELNEKIEKKYANFRNGANRDLDPEIDDLEEQYLGGLEQQEEHMRKIQELNDKLAKLLEARKRWLADVKERTAYTRRKKNDLFEQLKRAKKELKDLEAKQYAGDNSQFVKDRIEELKDIIENLEQQLKGFHETAGYGKGRTGDGDEEKVRVKFDLSGGTIDGQPTLDDMIIDKGTKITDYLALNSPELDDDHPFECWTVDGNPFDLDTPVDRDIVVKAKFRKRREMHTVTFRDQKGNVIRQLEVEEGELVPADQIPTLKDKLFKDFAGWGKRVPDSKDVVPINLFTLPVAADWNLYPVYKLNKEKTLATGLGCITTSLSIGGDLAVSAITANPIVLPVVSGPMTLLNGVLWNKTRRDKNAGQVPDEEAERTATGIRKAGIKLKNFELRHIDGLKRFFGTTALGTGIATITEGALALKDFLAGRKPTPTTIPTPTPTIPTPTVPTPTVPVTTVPTFQGVDPSGTIWKDTGLTQPNGRPAMQHFDHDLSYYRIPDGQELIPGQSPYQPGEAFQIVEHQPAGYDVVMGNQIMR